MIAFPLPAAAAELPAGVQQILQQSELTPDKLVHITLQELLQTLAGWLKNAWGQPLQLARRAVLFLLLSSCVGLLADGGAWRDCVDLVAVLGFGTIALNQMTSLVQQVAQAANTSQLYVSGFIPVFAGVALLAGQTAGAAVYSTMFYAMAAFLAEVLQNLLLPLLQIYFCFSVSAALWGDSGIADAANLFARCFTFALKLCGMLFTFVLGLQNVLAAGTDRAALKIGKSVLSAAVPVVGDAAAAALGSASAAIGLLKGSLALAAVAALGAAFAPVLAQCGLYWLGFSGYLGTIFLSGNSIHAVAAAWREWGLTYGYAVPRGTGLLHLVRPGWAGADILAAKWVQASHKCGAYAVYYNIGPPGSFRHELAGLCRAAPKLCQPERPRRGLYRLRRRACHAGIRRSTAKAFAAKRHRIRCAAAGGRRACAAGLPGGPGTGGNPAAKFCGEPALYAGEHPMTAKQSIAWLQAAWKDDKKRINLLLVSGLAGMLLLCMSEWLPAGQSTQNAAQSSQQSQTAAEYEQQLETRLAALIRAMDGAGETVVMVTLDCGEETTYAADTRTEKTSEDTRSSAASQRTHLLAGAQPVVQSVQAPQVRGVAVLCQGGGNAGTQRRITELVSALTGVGASHITVNKMQS